jgi:hypothetical protein
MDLKSRIKALVPNKLQYLLYKAYYIFVELRSLFYRGNRFTCPFCNQQFREFLSVKPGVYFLANEQCPKCDSWKRHRVMWLYLKNQTNLFSDRLKVLHIAPEYCFQRNFKNMLNLNYVSADLLSPLASTKMDITNIPYADNSFDVILCSHVLEHIPDDRKAMNELLRVLKATGWAILQVPIDRKRNKTFEDPTITSPKERERLFWQHDHVRLYGRDYKDRLEEVGFAVKVKNFVKELESDAIEQYGLDEQEEIYFCTKK